MADFKPRNLKRPPKLSIAADAIAKDIVRTNQKGVVSDGMLANAKVDLAGDTMTGELEVPSLVVNGGTSLTGILSATAELDFGSIATNSSAELTVTVTGAAAGDIAMLGPPAALTADLVFFCFVSAADTVTVRAVNATGGAIDPDSGTYRVAVLQF